MEVAIAPLDLPQPPLRAGHGSLGPRCSIRRTLCLARRTFITWVSHYVMHFVLSFSRNECDSKTCAAIRFLVLKRYIASTKYHSTIKTFLYRQACVHKQDSQVSIACVSSIEWRYGECLHPSKSTTSGNCACYFRAGKCRTSVVSDKGHSSLCSIDKAYQTIAYAGHRARYRPHQEIPASQITMASTDL
jgi:hypothetical protein